MGDKKWSFAKQTDKKVAKENFDHVGGFQRARVTTQVANPLTWWILIDSAKRTCVDTYDIQYQQVPHICFLCGRLRHSDFIYSTLGTSGLNGELHFGKG